MKRKIEFKKHTVDLLFVITLFCVFAFSLISLTGTGAAVYEKIVSNMDENYDSRTAGTYLFNKLHRSDKNNSVSLGTYAGLDSILMMEEIDNINYCTYLYFYDNKLMEIFTRYGQEIDPSYGTVIMELEDYSVKSLSPSLFQFDFTTTKGEHRRLFVHTRTSEPQ